MLNLQVERLKQLPQRLGKRGRAALSAFQDG